MRISEKSGRTTAHRDYGRPRSQHPEREIFENEEYTDQYEIGELDKDELQRRRNSRDTKDRLVRLEEGRDVLADSVKRLEANQAQTDGKVDKLNESVAKFSGQMEIMPQLVRAMQDATSQMAQRDHVKFTATVDVDKAKAIGEIEAKTEERKVDAHKTKAKWDIIVKVVAVISTITGIVATAIAAGC